MSSGDSNAGGTGNTPRVWGNIPPRNPNFTGREELLDQLHRRLLVDEATAVVPHAVHGMGGVGKSLLAVEYLYRRMAEYDVVWWIPAERTTQISVSLVELATRLELAPGSDAPAAVDAVLEALRIGEPYSNWLLVFDNAESPETVQRFFPAGGPGNILITSRNPQWASIARPLEVDVFRREESKQLLRLRGSEISDEDADRLAEALGDLPLAIEQAAAWHAETGMLVDEYLRLLGEKRLDLLRGTAPLDSQQPVIAAWNISLDQLETKNPAAYQLLQVCSFYAPEPIARALFARAPRGPIATELDAVLEDTIRLNLAIRDIGRYSLARFNRDDSLQMHRLVQAALQYRMTEEDRATMRRGAHLLLAANDPHDPNDFHRWDQYGSLYPHVVVSEAVRSQEHWVRNLVVNEVVYLLRRGDYASGRELARTAYKTWSETLGRDHPHTLLVARWLGFLLFSMGAYREAADLNASVLDAYRRTMGHDAQDTIDAVGNVAIDHRVRGDFAESLTLTESVHQQYLRMLGPEDPETLRAAHNLGVSLRLTGDFARARDIDEMTWNSYITMYGQDHVDTLRTWLGFILDIRELGEYGDALLYHQELVERSTSLLGTHHPSTLSAFHHLAAAQRLAGRHEQALRTAEQAQDALIRRYGPENPETQAAALELTVDLRQCGHVDRALADGFEVWHQLTRLYGHEHPRTLTAAVTLANTCRVRGDAAAAQHICRAALRHLTTRLGDDHLSSLACRSSLASCHHDLGEPDAALELDTDAYQRARRMYGDDHPHVLAHAVNVAVDLRSVGRSQESDQLRGRTVERFKRRLGSRHPAIRSAADLDRMVIDYTPMPL
ncbi:FxSxx-COOH system tetratricopeptide repeat protein [Streptomyces nigra]|uniref:FxSxx-COOH system tetratricopeptide repeat protein n=1 Tax=Streptomyces nigra TaxID=1827580 RepID=A0ABZ1ITF9_9ACTN